MAKNTELAKLRRKYPLPKDVPDAELNLTEAAAFLDVSTVTFGKYQAQGLPCLVQGGNGKEYVFRAADVWAWKRASEAGDEAKREAARATIQAMRMALVGGRMGSSIDALTPKEKREVISTQREIELLQRDRNELLAREDVADACEMFFGMVRDALDALPDEQAREAGLTNKQLGVAVDICDRTLTNLKTAIERFFADRPKRGARRRENLFDLN